MTKVCNRLKNKIFMKKRVDMKSKEDYRERQYSITKYLLNKADGVELLKEYHYNLVGNLMEIEILKE